MTPWHVARPMLAALLAVTAAGDALPPRARAIPIRDPAHRWMAHRAVAHAMGDVDGRTQTLSAEAFAASRAEGFALFECDFMPTADGQIVARHDWDAKRAASLGEPGGPGPWTAAEFAGRRPYGRYTPLDVDGVMKLLAASPETWLITDSKLTSPADAAAMFRRIVPAARAHGVLDRVVPQLYNEAMWPAIRAVHPFRTWIYTLYQTLATDDEVLAFCRRAGIPAVTMSVYRATPVFVDRLAAAGIAAYVHPVRSRETLEYWRARGMWGFYTETFTPADTGPPARDGVLRTRNLALPGAAP